MTTEKARTILEHFVEVFSAGRVPAALIALLVEEDAAAVHPVIVVGAEEMDCELADAVRLLLDVERNVIGMTDLTGPPPDNQNRADVLQLDQSQPIQHYRLR